MAQRIGSSIHRPVWIAVADTPHFASHVRIGVAIPFRRRERWAWHAICWSTLLWFTVDSLVSALHCAYFNIYLINLMPLAIFGIPLFATWSMVLGAPRERKAI